MIQPRNSPETKIEARPEGYHALTPALTCANARREIDFLKQALGATERRRMEDPESKEIAHAELEIGDSVFILSDAIGGPGSKPIKELGGSPVSFYLYVPDVDAAFARATNAGAKVVQPVKEQFWGDRVGTIECPEGYHWSFATHTRDLTPEQVRAGYGQMKKQMAGAKK